MATASDKRIRIGVSSCLVGENVRYDGDNREDAYVTGTLGKYFELVPVCPEVELGMGVPRETVRLEGAPDTPRMVATGSGADWTERMQALAERRGEELARLELRGFIFKKGSPSCGLHRVPVFDAEGRSRRAGRGLFADAAVRRFPLLPMEDEEGLKAVEARGSFIVRVFALERLQVLLSGALTASRLVAFHSEHKVLLIAHSPRYYSSLGRLVAQARAHELDQLAPAYASLFMQALSTSSTAKRNYRALLRLMGYS